jgi:hypothetical protein
MSATMCMRRCLDLAEIAAMAGDTAVGALIVRGDEVVAEGVERTRAMLDPSAHAEVEAIRVACQRLETLDLRGCFLYSTSNRASCADMRSDEPASPTSSTACRRDRPARARPRTPSSPTLISKGGRRFPRSPVACSPTNASPLCDDRRGPADDLRALACYKLLNVLSKITQRNE